MAHIIDFVGERIKGSEDILKDAVVSKIFASLGVAWWRSLAKGYVINTALQCYNLVTFSSSISAPVDQ